jgi:hypothetical protein
MATTNTPKPSDPAATPAATPAASSDRDKLFEAAQVKASGLTREYADAIGVTDEMLGQIARGEVPGPPIAGPIRNTDVHLTPAGWQQTPHGVKPEDVGKDAIAR